MLISSTPIGQPIPTTSPGFRTVFWRSRCHIALFPKRLPSFQQNITLSDNPAHFPDNFCSSLYCGLCTLYYLLSFTQYSALSTQDGLSGGSFPHLPPPPPPSRQQTAETSAQQIFALYFGLCTWYFLLSYRNFGGSLSCSRHAMAKFSQRRITPLFAPHFRQLGGASRLSRHFCATKIRNLAAVPALPAVQFGSNFANSATKLSFAL
jgi:hypothetical protein